MNNGVKDLRKIRAARLRSMIKERGLTQTSLAERVGATQGAISQILTGSTSNSRLIPMIAAELQVNFDWLSGVTDVKVDMRDFEGNPIDHEDLPAWFKNPEFKDRRVEYDARPEMLDQDIISTGVSAEAGVADNRLAFRHAAPEPKRDPDLVEIEQVDLRYGMGGTYLDGAVEASKLAFSRTFLRHLTTVAPEHLFWALGDGDSMEPTIRSGELVLIDRSQQTPRMGDGIWAVAWGDIGMIKRLRPLPDGSVEINSDNPLVHPVKAVDGELHVIGRVVAVVRRL